MSKLTIEEHVEEPQEKFIEHEWLAYYYDEKTGIPIERMLIKENLEIGKVYDFTFDNGEDVDTYCYKVIKKIVENEYLLAEYYGKLYRCKKEKLVLEKWIICDMQKEFGINLLEME